VGEDKKGGVMDTFQEQMNGLIAQISPRQRSRAEELTEQINARQLKDRKRILIMQAFLFDVKIMVEKAECRLKELDRE